MQAWRWAGFRFQTLYTYGVLPGIFAWPAGLGDMAVGVTAPLVLAALLRRPGFVAYKFRGLEPFRHFGPYRGCEHRGAGPAARSQFLRSCFNGSYDAVAPGAGSDILGADILDAAFDCCFRRDVS